MAGEGIRGGRGRELEIYSKAAGLSLSQNMSLSLLQETCFQKNDRPGLEVLVDQCLAFVGVIGHSLVSHFYVGSVFPVFYSQLLP